MDENGCLPLFLLILGIAFGFLVGWIVYRQDKPTAMEVYQGKTTLVISYKDGVAVDSTVVFK